MCIFILNCSVDYFPPNPAACLIISDLQVSSTRSTDSQSGVKLTVDWSAELPVLDGCTHGYNLSYSADQTPPYPDGRRQVVRTQTETLRGDQTNYTIDSALPFAEYTVMIHAFEGEDEGETLQQTLRTIAIGEHHSKYTAAGEPLLNEHAPMFCPV